MESLNMTSFDGPFSATAKRGQVVNRFVRKVSGHGTLQEGDLRLLETASSSFRPVSAHRDLISEGDKPGPTFIVLEGWVCRYKVLPNGSRQILAFLLPGDFCDLHVGHLDQMDHSIGTLTKCMIATVPRERMDALIVASPALTHAFWRTQLVDEGVLRSWIVSMGRRDSIERVAHLMLELFIRMRNVDLASGETVSIPLTQTELADAHGLTPVHLNRVLRVLRERNAMTLRGKTLNILDVRQLVRIAGFDENYLHRLVPDANDPGALKRA